MQTITLEISASEGLHARPAQLFCARAGQFQSEVKVRNVTTSSKMVNAKSILLVLTLGVVKGHQVEISASGSDEELAIQGLKDLIEGGFSA